MSILLFPVWTESPVCVPVYKASGNTRTDELVLLHFRALVTGNTQSRLFACLILSHDKTEKNRKKTENKKSKQNSTSESDLPPEVWSSLAASPVLDIFSSSSSHHANCTVFVSLQRPSATSLCLLLLREQHRLSLNNLFCDLCLIYHAYCVHLIITDPELIHKFPTFPWLFVLI